MGANSSFVCWVSLKLNGRFVLAEVLAPLDFPELPLLPLPFPELTPPPPPELPELDELPELAVCSFTEVPLMLLPVISSPVLLYTLRLLGLKSTSPFPLAE